VKLLLSLQEQLQNLGLPSEQHYLKMGGGVSACAVCDGFSIEIKRLLSWEPEIL
jgi:thioredoxin reductase